MKSPYPGVSTRLIRWPFHSQYARAVLTEILRLISSGSKSVVVVPSSTLPRRLTAPVVKSIDSTSDVFPTPPWPTTPTFRILLISIAIDLPPADEGAWRADANTAARGDGREAGPASSGAGRAAAGGGSSARTRTQRRLRRLLSSTR